jgi:hypothetical protein
VCIIVPLLCCVQVCFVSFCAFSRRALVVVMFWWDF